MDPSSIFLRHEYEVFVSGSGQWAGRESQPRVARRPSRDRNFGRMVAVPGHYELSEAQLRRLYDEEEAERLMHLISAYVTEDLILPYLPPDGPTPPPFTIKRFRLTSQRLYLAIVPTYRPLLSDLISLALWKDRQRSLLYCTCFWVLWYNNGLLAAFLCRIIWSLLRRRFLPYLTLAEFQEKQQNTSRACRFGDEVQRRLSVSTLGPIEIWKLFRAYRTATHDKTKHLLKSKIQSRSDQTDEHSTSVSVSDGENTILEGAEDSEEVQNLKREPVLSVMALAVIILPAQYIVKITYMLLGIVYWHLVPVVAALSPEGRARIPPLFADAPTDVEYAMELIGQRVASGQELPLRSKDRGRLANSTGSSLDLTATESIDSEAEDRGAVNWKKWGARVAQGKSLLEENKSISSLSRALLENLLHQKQTGTQLEEVHTFPAQHSSALGLITLTSAAIHFTAFTAMRAKLTVPFSQLRGVKKTGLAKGLVITWVATDQDTQDVVKEERFHWVGDRDQLFARLLGHGGGRWMGL
ncbi:hypothetical protein EDC04DRAFT_2863857 [Pisolithus marmoratus]|nr:hypothetical protein EDC04DRAFT_2863857 [Pisolithus marmoratus]